MKRRNERGAAMAEAALVLPILVIMLFAITQFGLALNRAQSLEAAAREGARLASIQTSSSADITARVNSTLSGIALNSGPTTAVSPGVCAGREGQTVTVTVSGTFNITVPLVRSWSLPLSGQAVFRCEA